MSSFAATVKIKGSDSSETLVTIYQTTRFKIPHNRNVHIHCLKYFKCHNIQLRSSRTWSTGYKHLVNYIRYKFLKENDTMITTRNKTESDFCSIFKGPKNMYAICPRYRERTFHVGSKLCQFYVQF